VRTERYERLKNMGLIDADWPLTPRDEEAADWNKLDAAKKQDMDLRMAVYAAMIDHMDQNIGRLIHTLNEKNILENTLVLFLADNGGSAEGGPLGFSRNNEPPGTPDSYASYGLSWANASNAPFRLYKSWVHEGGIATPLIAHWPAIIKRKGALTHQIGHVIDLAATCYEAAGATYPALYQGRLIEPLDGRSLLPIFTGDNRTDHNAIFWEHQGNRAVRKNDWKLVSKHPNSWELYNLRTDRTELTNLAAKHPELVAELKELYRRWTIQSNVEPWSQLRK